jgi:prolyl 4-hydroxylase
MTRRRLDAAWKSWLAENIKRQCDPDTLLGVLIENNFTLESIKANMGKHFPIYSPRLAARGEKTAAAAYKALCEIRLTREANGANTKRFPSDAVQIYTIDDFMSGAECEALARIIRGSLRSSTVTIESPGDKYFRTSNTSDLSLLKNNVVDALDDKIARTLGIRPAYSEGIQGQHYAVSQEFKPHTDFFEPGSEEFATYGGSRGNRTWTFMVYLNTVTAGGGTRFLNLGHDFQPKTGMALAWNNLYADGTPNYDTLHAGLPVEAGHKVIITKWFRERGTGEMFFD